MMSNPLKYIFYIVIILALIGSHIAVYKLARKPVPPAQITTNEYTEHTTIPVVTKIIEKNVPAVIETLFVDGHNYELAKYSATIDTNKVSVALDIEYDEKDNTFDVRHNITAIRDSVYHEKITEIIKEQKPPLIRLTGSIGAGFEKDAGDNVYRVQGGDFSIGVKFVNKYSVMPFVAVREDKKPLYGLRLGIDF